MPSSARDCGAVTLQGCIRPEGVDDFDYVVDATAQQKAAFDCLLDAGRDCEAARLWIDMPMTDRGYRTHEVVAVVPDATACHYLVVQDTGKGPNPELRFQYAECDQLAFECTPVDIGDPSPECGFSPVR